jgi:hypothetical protein
MGKKIGQLLAASAVHVKRQVNEMTVAIVFGRVLVTTYGRSR